jgi:hypothetical protein
VGESHYNPLFAEGLLKKKAKVKMFLAEIMQVSYQEIFDLPINARVSPDIV